MLWLKFKAELERCKRMECDANRNCLAGFACLPLLASCFQSSTEGLWRCTIEMWRIVVKSDLLIERSAVPDVLVTILAYHLVKAVTLDL